MRRSRFAPSLAAGLALLAAALPARGADPRVLKIGACLSLTGPAAVYGAQQKAGILAAVEELNRQQYVPGVKLQVVIEDDASTKEQGIAVYQRLIAREKVAAILGPTLSNTATAAAFLPLLGALAVAQGLPPEMLAIPAAIAASCAFMMPVATPPNAIVFGTGQVSIHSMIKAGFALNLFGVFLVTVLCYLLVGWIWAS